MTAARSPARVPRLLLPPVFAALFAGLLFAGNSFYFADGNVATFWPAVGLVLSVLILADVRQWWWIAAIVLAVQFPVDRFAYDRPASDAFLFAAINFLEPAVGALIVRRLGGGSLATLRGVLVLTGAILVSAAIGGCLGAGVVVARVPVAAFPSVWQVWWSSDLLGALIVAPAVLVWARRGPVARPSRRAIVEIALAFGALVLLAVVVFARTPGGDSSILDSPYGILPALLWIAIRSGPRGLTLALLAVSAIAISGGDAGRGPFADEPVFRHIISLQWFLGVTAFTLLSLTVVADERRRYRESLEESELRYRRYVEHSTEGIYRAELSAPVPVDVPEEERLDRIAGGARIAEANDALARLRGYAHRDELIGMPLGGFFAGDDEEARRTLLHCARSGETGAERRVASRDRDGRARVLLESTLGIVEEGRLVRIWGLVRDITDLDQAERSLRESEAKYRVVAETGADAILTIDRDSRIVYANPAVVRIFGWEVDELTGKPVTVLMPESLGRAHLAAFRRYRETGRRSMDWRRFETTARHRNGRYIPVEIAVGELGTGSGSRVTGIIRDVSDRREAEETVRRYEERLRALASEISLVEQRERRNLAAELHDHIVQNLAVTRLKLASMHASLADTPFSKELAELRELADETIQDSRSLLYDLSPPVLYELGFVPALDWLAERIERQHGLSVIVDVDDTSDIEPRSEDVRIVLFQAVREALVNVGKHAHVTEATLSVGRIDDLACVRIVDEGVGFDLSLHGPEWSEAGGFGLFSVRERLRALGGQIEVVSAPGDGTRVTLTAPIGAGTPVRVT